MENWTLGLRMEERGKNLVLLVSPPNRFVSILLKQEVGKQLQLSVLGTCLQCGSCLFLKPSHQQLSDRETLFLHPSPLSDKDLLIWTKGWENKGEEVLCGFVFILRRIGAFFY